MNSKYLPGFAQASPIAKKWHLLNRLQTSQFLVNIKLPKSDHPGTGKYGILCPKSIILVSHAESIVSRTDRPKLLNFL